MPEILGLPAPIGLLLGLLLGCVGALPVILFQHIRAMVKDPGLHLWPSVTRCRLCDKRVFVWQRRERRAMNADLDNPDRIATWVTGSCIVHKTCKGTPTFQVAVKLGHST